ncbi:phosphate starvation protein PhoH [Bacteroidia bacterium]|nr:phosphate starvation protein PhoH [Bacteroidia bacterium]
MIIMSEKTITLKSISPLELFGAQERNLTFIRHFFPKVKIIARGNDITVSGSDDDIEFFEEKLNAFINHIDKFNKLDEEDIVSLMDSKGFSMNNAGADDVLVHGVNGKLIKARTANQVKMVESIASDDMVFAVGPAGSGKTYTAVALAVKALKNKEVKRIILTRPAVEAGENLGFLPGDLKDKLDPYLQPLYDALRDMIPVAKLASYLEDHTIEIAPLAFMRGRTLDNAFVILDEAQNATEMQMKMFLTRMGRSAKFVITGDITQIDLPRNQSSGLLHALKILKNIKGIKIVELTEKDIIRHKLVSLILKKYDVGSYN